MLRSIGRGGVVLIALLTFVGAARADKAGERAIEMKAREDFAAGRYEDALNRFAKLYAETLNAVYLRNIGRCHQKMREPQKAIDAFQDYLGKEKKISADERAEINGYIKEMTALRDEQAQKAAPPPPIVPVAPAPPPPSIMMAPPPASATAMLTAQPAPPAQAGTPIYTKWWFWTAIGAVVAGVVVAALVIPGGTTKPACPPEATGGCR